MTNEIEFQLDDRLERDTVKLVAWPLSDVLLMNDCQYPWVILVPRRPGVSEIYQLSESDQQQLLKESVFLGEQLMAAYSGEKLNVAALGNVVNQLHVHHVIRFAGDKAWPGPVWGKFPAEPYTAIERSKIKAKLQFLSEKQWV